MELPSGLLVPGGLLILKLFISLFTKFHTRPPPPQLGADDFPWQNVILYFRLFGQIDRKA